MASSDKQILTYSINGVDAVIDIVAFTINVELPYNTPVTALIATFTSSTLSTTNVGITEQISGTTSNDFTNPVTYTVTAEDLSTQDYLVTVNITPASTKKEITSYEVEDLTTGLVTANSIQLKVVEGTDVTALVPTIEISEFATIDPLTEVAQDFTNQIEYTVTAQDLSTFRYLASVVFLPNHNAVYSVWDSLLARLKFVEDTTENKNLASLFTVETMYEFEPCFNVSQINVYPERIGNEVYYNVVQKSLTADIIAMRFLYDLILINVAGNNQTSDGIAIAPSQTFLTKAVAGSVESDFEQFSIKDTAFVGLDTTALLELLKSEIIRKALYMNCIYDISSQCEISVCSSGANSNLTFGVSG